MPLGIPDTRAFPWDQSLKSHLGQLNNGVTGGINTWATNPTVGVDGLTLGTNHVGYTGVNTSTGNMVRWNGTEWIRVIDGYKTINTSQLDLYVNQATGNDTNDGNTASTAWKTTSKLYQELALYNTGGKQVNINLGAGAYSLAFPNSLDNGRVHVKGASSASVTIQKMGITNGLTCLLQGVTVAYPELPNEYVYWFHTVVEKNSSLVILSDVVLGAIGRYTAGSPTRFPFLIRSGSIISLYANYPMTIIADLSALFLLDTGAAINVWCYQPADTTATTLPNHTPINKGTPYSSLAALTASDTEMKLNFIGSRKVDSVFTLNGAVLAGGGGWKLVITGSVTGKAYELNYNSTLGGSPVYVGTGIYQGVIYPTTISAGTKDSTSTITTPGNV